MIHIRTCTVCRANDIQQELDEYTENSAQLEKELEASLVQVEKQNRDLEHQNQRLKNEIEILRVSNNNYSARLPHQLPNVRLGNSLYSMYQRNKINLEHPDQD